MVNTHLLVTKGLIKGYKAIRSKELLNSTVSTVFYKGGFNSVMTKREAQLILGVKEGQDAKTIQDRHKKLMVINHPDTGGSTFLATKVNEAKEFLMKN